MCDFFDLELVGVSGASDGVLFTRRLDGKRFDEDDDEFGDG